MAGRDQFLRVSEAPSGPDMAIPPGARRRSGRREGSGAAGLWPDYGRTTAAPLLAGDRQVVQNSAASMPFRLYSSQSGQSPFMLSTMAWLPSAVE